MAGSIQVINPRRTGFQEFTEAANPYIQQAFAMMLQRKAQEQQRQQDLQRAIQMGLYQPQYEQIGREISGEGLKYPALLPPQEQSQFYADIGKKKYAGKTIPEKYLKFSPEGAKTLPPGLQIPLGNMQYNVPSTYGTMPIINITPEGKTEQIGTAPKGARIVTPSQMESPEQKVQRAIETERGKEQVKTQTATKESIGEFQGFIKQFERSYDELTEAYPSIGTKGISGYGQRLIAGLGEKAGYFPETTAFLREIQPMANKMARTIEGGRVTDEDRKIYADSFANALSAPSQTNIRLASDALLNAYRKGGNISQILETLRTSDNEILQGIVNEVEQNISNPQQIQPSGQFDFSQMSDEELLRRRQQLMQGGGQ